MSLLAHGVRKGWIVVHAFVLMTNHYHLLVSSEGKLSVFMQWAMSKFVRRFNKPRDRDGPLFRGRFRARRVCSEADFRNVVRYIDRNPVDAGLCDAADAYPFGSAQCYCHRTDRPLWLHRAEVERLAVKLSLAPLFGSAAYERTFHDGVASIRWWVERRIEVESSGDDPLVLLEANRFARTELVAWLRCGPGRARWVRRPPLVAPNDLVASIARLRMEQPRIRTTDRREGDAWDAMTCGLLRVACGLSITETARLLGVSVDAARARCSTHAQLTREEPYARWAADALAGALRVIA